MPSIQGIEFPPMMEPEAFASHIIDPQQKIPFAPEELAIVHAAIGLGEWLLLCEELKQSQHRAIRRIQRLLANGVFAPHGESYYFCLDAIRNDLSRSWCVYLSDRMLEIFSDYSPIPPCYEQDSDALRPAFWHMVDQEDWYIWYADGTHNDAYDVSRWVEEISHPERYRSQDFSLEPDVDDLEEIPDGEGA